MTLLEMCQGEHNAREYGSSDDLAQMQESAFRRIPSPHPLSVSVEAITMR